jgi:hypothetical protein
MTESGSAPIVANVLPYLGSLFGVVVGASLTWLLHRNEWGRQRRWELRRDVVLDAVRALADLDGSVGEVHRWSHPPTGNLTKEAEDAFNGEKIGAMKLFDQCSSSYQRAHTVADLVIGGNLSRSISGYFQFALPLVRNMLLGRSSFDKNAQKDLAKLHNSVILSAREALGIKDTGDLPVLDYERESLTTDH